MKKALLCPNLKNPTDMKKLKRDLVLVRAGVRYPFQNTETVRSLRDENVTTITVKIVIISVILLHKQFYFVNINYTKLHMQSYTFWHLPSCHSHVIFNLDSLLSSISFIKYVNCCF
uniref:Uncharacterized protein n=1 Tax=Onchocerca volvulus TaxID=6282 RepID=A0A8R1Y2A8_ONCVO